MSALIRLLGIGLELEEINDEATQLDTEANSLEGRVDVMNSAVDLFATYRDAMASLADLQSKNPEMQNNFKKFGFDPQASYDKTMSPSKLDALRLFKTVNSENRQDVLELKQRVFDVKNRAKQTNNKLIGLQYPS